VALKVLRADVAQVELDWLAVAEDLESG
jgi:hypothetical protein